MKRKTHRHTETNVTERITTAAITGGN